MSREYRYISADSHMEGPPTRWNHRVPAEYRNRAARIVELPTGGNAVVVEGQPLMVHGFGQYTRRPPEEYAPNLFQTERWDAVAPGWGSAEERVRDLDVDGIDAEVLFPGTHVPLVYEGMRTDKAAYNAMIRAYNGWLAEEYCAVAPDRLIGLGIIPITGVEHAIAEMEYCAKMGLKGIDLVGFPSGRWNPTPEDDKFWAAAIDLKIAVTAHISFNELRPAPPGERFKYPREPDVVAGGADFVGRLARYARAGGVDAVKLVVAGVFDRFPKLHIYWAETQIGWIPNFLEQMDNNYRVHRYWADDVFGVKLARRPSEYIQEHCWWGFMYNPVGVRMRHEIGVDRLMWGSDFPHVETHWPHTLDMFEEMFTGVPEDEKYKVVAGNAIQFFHLDHAEKSEGTHQVASSASAA